MMDYAALMQEKVALELQLVRAQKEIERLHDGYRSGAEAGYAEAIGKAKNEIRRVLSSYRGQWLIQEEIEKALRALLEQPQDCQPNVNQTEAPLSTEGKPENHPIIKAAIDAVVKRLSEMPEEELRARYRAHQEGDIAQFIRDMCAPRTEGKPVLCRLCQQPVHRCTCGLATDPAPRTEGETVMEQQICESVSIWVCRNCKHVVAGYWAPPPDWTYCPGCGRRIKEWRR